MNEINSFRFYDTSYFDLKTFISENIFIFLRRLQKICMKMSFSDSFFIISSFYYCLLCRPESSSSSSDTQIWLWCAAGTIRPAALVFFISFFPHIRRGYMNSFIHWVSDAKAVSSISIWICCLKYIICHSVFILSYPHILWLWRTNIPLWKWIWSLVYELI